MESKTVTLDVYLVQSKTGDYFTWVGTDDLEGIGYPGHAILYEVGNESSTLVERSSMHVPNLGYPGIISGIKEALNSSTGRSYIDMFVTHDKGTDVYKVVVRMVFDDTLVRKLLNLVPEPKINVFGRFGGYSFRAEMDMKTVNHVDDFEGADTIVKILKEESEEVCLPVNLSVSLKWEEIDNLGRRSKRKRSEVLDKVFSDKLFNDCSILTGDKTEVSCHRNILAANSDVICAMLANGLQETQTARIDMSEFSEQVVNLMVKYLYGRDIDHYEEGVDVLYQLLRAGHKYNILGLEELMMKALYIRANHTFHIDEAMALYAFTVNVDSLSVLSDKMLRILKTNPKQMMATSAYQDILENDPKRAAKLVMKLLELVSN